MIRSLARGRTRSGEVLPPLRERLQALRLVPRFMTLVWRTHPTYGAVIVLLRVLAAAGPLAQLWIGKLLIDAVVASRGAEDPDWRRIGTLITLELLIVLAMDILQRLSILLESMLGDLFANAMSVRIMEHAAQLDLSYFEEPEFYDRLERARKQTTGRVVLIGTLLSIAQRLLTFTLLLGGLLAFNPWLLLILIVAILPSFLGETHYAGVAYSLMYSLTPERRELDYLRYVAASSHTAKEVKLFGLSDHFIKRYATLATRYYRANREIAVRRAATGIVLSSLSTLAYYGAVAFIVAQAVAATITLGTLTFLIASFNRGRTLISGILDESATIYEQSLFVRDLFRFLEIQPPAELRAGTRRVARPLRSGFVFEDVGFRYPGRSDFALRNVSFTLRPGERIALVGENGAGKTTLVKLLTRLYLPTEGRILLDGVDLREYDQSALRNEVGVIFQDFVCYDMIARENIALGRIEALDDDARIRAAASRSLATEVLARLPGGLDQMLGRRFNGGANLSGGEWQKIALARAYMRDAQVLILDEPTAALDPRAEYKVFLRFSELTAGRIAILISHRFSTVRMADRILVLDGGRLLEQGSHHDLVAQEGRYAELFSLQAAGYR